MTRHRLSWPDTLAALFSGRMLVALLMGFSSGLPLLLTGSVLQAWLKDGGVDLGRFGLFALIGLPYTLKFLWSPLFDRYALPLGRRRGWLALMQLAVAGALLLLSAATGSGPSRCIWSPNGASGSDQRRVPGAGCRSPGFVALRTLSG